MIHRHCLLAPLLLLAGLFPARAEPVSFDLVKDINTETRIAESRPSFFREVDGLVHFSAITPERGAELYASDGSVLQFVYEFAAGPASSFPKVVGRAGGRLIVEADDGIEGTALRALDRATGSVQTLLPYGFRGGDQPAQARPVAQLSNRLLFIYHQQLWTTDGTPAGTSLLMPGVIYARRPGDGVCQLGNTVLFLVRNASQQIEIWRSDGSSTGYTRLNVLTVESGFAGASGGGGQCYFLFQRELGWSLWRSDGGAASPVALQASGTPRGVAAAASQFAYVIDGSSTSFRLWRTNAVQPIVTYPLESVSGYLRTVGDRLVFVAPYQHMGNTWYGVFLSDGTTAGTLRLSAPGSSALPEVGSNDFVIGDTLVFSPNGQLWRLDAAAATLTPAGPDTQPLNVDDGALLANRVLTGSAGQVWRTDGTAAGTVALHAPWLTTGDTIGLYPRSLALGSVLFFTVDYEPTVPRRLLWRSDGTSVGTYAAPLDIETALGDIHSMETLGGDLFVSGPPPQGADNRVYRLSADFSDGSLVTVGAHYPGLQSTGSAVLMGCSTGVMPNLQHHLCALAANQSNPAIVSPQLMQQGIYEPAGQTGGAGLFYLRGGSVDGLWRSDGTAPGTSLLLSGLRHRDSLRPVSFAFGGELLLDACKGPQCGIWATDGTAAGTRLLVAVPNPIRQFVKLGSRVAYTTGSASLPNQLWISDLSPAGTTPLRIQDAGYIVSVDTVGQRLHAIVTDDNFGNSLSYLVSDGSAAGTQPVALPADLRPGNFVTALDTQTALFSCHLPDAGWETCLIGASGADARLGADLYPGAPSALPALLGRTSEGTYLVVDDGRHGREPWLVRGDELFADGFE